MSFVICAIFRNEAPYLREWIEFHRLVGCERFFLYQNRSDDDWPRVLGPYVQRGIVDLADWPSHPPCQMEAYEHFIATHRGHPGWVAFLDCDEFLFSPCCATVPEALARLPPACGAVGVNWMCFGASGHETRTPGPVIERFTRRPADDFGPNLHIKSIVQIDRLEGVSSDPHHFRVRSGTFSELGDRVDGPFTSRPSHRLLRINHYATKSREEFLTRIARGKADMQSTREPSEYEHYQAAAVDDRAIWRFLPMLQAALSTPLD